MPADIWPAIGPGGDYDYRKLKVNAQNELVAYVVNSLTGTFRPSGLTVAGKIAHLPIDDTQWYPAPATAQAGRNNLTIQNISGNNGIVLWNYSDSAPATEGFRIFDQGYKSVSITDSIPVFIRMLSGAGEVVIEEEA